MSYQEYELPGYEEVIIATKVFFLFSLKVRQ